MPNIQSKPNVAINYIELPARDLDAIEQFYSQAFGWTFTPYGPDSRAFSDGAMDGGFYRADVQSSTQNGSALVILLADDLEHVLQRVVDAGGAIVKPIFAFPGGSRFHFADPNGNELAVWSKT